MKLKTILVAAVLAATIAGAASQLAHAGPAEPAVPSEIAVEAGHKLYLVGHAVGWPMAEGGSQAINEPLQLQTAVWMNHALGGVDLEQLLYSLHGDAAGRLLRDSRILAQPEVELRSIAFDDAVVRIVAPAGETQRLEEGHAALDVQ